MTSRTRKPGLYDSDTNPMTNGIEVTGDRINTRIDGSLKGRIEAYMADSGKNQSEVVREALRQYLPESEDGWKLPDEDDLREAYKTLVRLSGAEGTEGRVNAGQAASVIAQKQSTPKDLIKNLIFRPLERQGYIKAKAGRIHVRPAPTSATSTSEAEA